MACISRYYLSTKISMYMIINYQDGEVNLKGEYIYIYIYIYIYA